MKKYSDGGVARQDRLNQHHKGDGGCCPNSLSGRRLRSSSDKSKSSRHHCPSVVERPTRTVVVTLSMLLLLSLFANDCVAFRNQLPLPTGRASQVATRNSHNFPFQKSSTSLSYKNDRGDLPNQKQDMLFSSRSKRSKVPSKKKYKARRKALRIHKKGTPATEEELTHHVQSVFSDLEEFCEQEDNEEETIILSEPGDEDGDGNSSSAMQRQLNSYRKLDQYSALVLNADYRPLRMLPLSIWSWQDTVKAVLSGKAVVVDVYPGVIVRAVSLDMSVPSVIAMLEYAPIGKTRPAFTRRNVYLRDGYRCQYCSELFRSSDLSLDHVEPRCMGGRLSWDNTVTCCRKCNGRKGHVRPSELHRIGMKLQTEPRCPSLFELSAEANKFVPRRVHPAWAPFLGSTTAEKEERRRAQYVKEGVSVKGRAEGRKKKKEESWHLQDKIILIVNCHD
eukprot:CAMPEP_0172298878 /NCGR_PEP_ID=MMETSP1058-20130122/1327_1 /TAXON_ID=83371 /ORGANISM="Detonula confervacea, Strain CCMP 353" /LENGTH=447 /DNA_ID=CAMNT_0013008173 /DNA_START=126 /DNA_END=1470 /DNA_ORIENTATION=+